MARPVRIIACINERLAMSQKSCAGTGGSRELIAKLRVMMDSEGMASIEIIEQVCLGRCIEGAIMRIAPGGSFFTEIQPEQLSAIVDSLKTFIANRPE
ncbi:MAG: (2Fe-2S) ferredoxin [Gammaproteobacteria bacterium]|jgi:(2Fe-2S) ferredoxin